MVKFKLKRNLRLLFISAFILPSIAVFLSIILLIWQVGIKTLTSSKKATILKIETPQPAILLGAIADISAQYQTCPRGRFIYGTACHVTDRCQGPPDYTVSWSYNRLTDFKSRRPNSCWHEQTQPRYTFEDVLSDNPQSTSEGKEIYVKIVMDDQSVLLTGWGMETTDKNEVKLAGSFQGGHFTNPGPTQIIKLKVYTKGEFNLNHLWFYSSRERQPHPPAGRTYTLDRDFDEGSLINVAHTPHDQLQLANESKAFNFIWVAVSSKGTVVKINTETGQVLGEYYTSPDGQPKDPSRTTVDKNGNVWVANRAGNSVTHIGLSENNQCVDKNGNGRIDTSTGLNDIKPWTNAGGADTNGGVTTAQDECLIHYARVSSYGTRHLSVNADNNVWVSGIGSATDPRLPSRKFDLIDSRTGQILRTEGPVGYGGYGGLIDKNGVIWSANQLLRWDTTKHLTGPNGENWRGYNHDSYGLCIDSKGFVWNTTYTAGKILKFSPDGNLVGEYYHGFQFAQGCVVDKNDHVWVAHSISGGGHTVGHLKNNGVLVGFVNVGSGPTGVAVDAAGKIWATNFNSFTVSRIDPNRGPIGYDGQTRVGEVDFTSVPLGGALYNYSDMTGSTLIGAPDYGSWTVVFDTQIENARWGKISWNSKICQESSLKVMVSTSEDRLSFGQERVVRNNEDLNGLVGRYLKIKVIFERKKGQESPVLYDLTIGTIGYPVLTVTNRFLQVDAGPDQTANISQPLKLNGKVCYDDLSTHNLTIQWQQVNSVPSGTTTFADPGQPKTTAAFNKTGAYYLRLNAWEQGRIESINDETIITVAGTPPTPQPIPCNQCCFGVGPAFDQTCQTGLACLDTNVTPAKIPNLRCRNANCRFDATCVCPTIAPSPTITPTPIPTRTPTPTRILTPTITPTPTPRTLTCRFVSKWGSLGSNPGQFYKPAGLALSTEGNKTYLYVTDYYGVSKFDTQGNFILRFGENIHEPAGVAIDHTNRYVYVLDKSSISTKVFVFSVAGNYLRQFGQNEQFNEPEGILVTQSGVYIADTNNSQLQKVSTYGGFMAKYEFSGYYHFPSGLGLYQTSTNSDDDFYMTDVGDHHVKRFKFKYSQNSFSLTESFGHRGSGDAQFESPKGVTVYKLYGLAFVADTGNHRIQALGGGGSFYGKWGTYGDQDLQFNNPSGITVNDQGDVFVADTDNHRIQKLSCSF